MPMSPHVRALRAKVGSDPLMLPSVTMFLFDEQGRVLLAQGGDGLWMTIGGAIDPNETPADAAVREFWEETGLLVEPARLLGAFGGPGFRVTYPNGDVTLYTSIIFEVRRLSGEPTPDKVETFALRFTSREAAAELPMAVWTRELVAIAFARGAEPHFTPATWRPPRPSP